MHEQKFQGSLEVLIKFELISINRIMILLKTTSKRFLDNTCKPVDRIVDENDHWMVVHQFNFSVTKVLNWQWIIDNNY
jgi:hypothetical protein